MLRESARRLPRQEGVGSFGERINVGSRCQVRGSNMKRTGVQWACLDQWIMFRSRINIGANSRDGALCGFETRHAKVCDLYNSFVRAEQQVLWLDITMDNSRCMRVCQPG